MVRGDMARFNLQFEIECVIDEIMRHKWLESEKAGYDIGEEEAALDWIEKHYDEWLKHNISKFVVDNGE